MDTAYEAVDSMEASGDSESLDRWWETVNTSYDGNNIDSYVHDSVSIKLHFVITKDYTFFR